MKNKQEHIKRIKQEIAYLENLLEQDPYDLDDETWDEFWSADAMLYELRYDLKCAMRVPNWTQRKLRGV